MVKWENQPESVTVLQPCSMCVWHGCNYSNMWTLFQFYDGPTYNDTELLKACGSSLPNNTIIQSTGNQMFVRMRTDASSNARGFKASYKQGVNENNQLCTPWMQLLLDDVVQGIWVGHWYLYYDLCLGLMLKRTNDIGTVEFLFTIICF